MLSLFVCVVCAKIKEVDLNDVVETATVLEGDKKIRIVVVFKKVRLDRERNSLRPPTKEYVR